MVDQPGLRYSDTIVFASEWIMNPLDSERARLSLNRVNFIHSRYRDITNDQMVYTLCLLVSETFVSDQRQMDSRRNLIYISQFRGGSMPTIGGRRLQWRNMPLGSSGMSLPFPRSLVILKRLALPQERSRNPHGYRREAHT